MNEEFLEECRLRIIRESVEETTITSFSSLPELVWVVCFSFLIKRCTGVKGGLYN